jgi:uncharacterized radical SAM superfamily Fe-S cluster-containing enzyme
VREISLRQLEETESLCPVCYKLIPAQVVTDEKKVFLQKKCKTHGQFCGSVWTDYDLYVHSYRFQDFCNISQSPGSDGKSLAKVVLENVQFELQQRTCLALLEVTDRCNLRCPVCIANSFNANGDLAISQIERMLKSVKETGKNGPPVQISGGEPTVREDLSLVVSLAKKLNFKFVEVNTNGIEIGRKPDLSWQLADSGLDGIYLQFDGFNGRANELLRGKDLLKLKLKAIENCMDVGMSVTLAATIVKGVNEDQIWPIIEFAIAQGVLGVNFQPFTPSGRFPNHLAAPLEKVTASDVIKAVENQSGGKISAEDFVPILCQDNRCALIAYILIEKKEVVPLNRKIKPNFILDHYAKLSSWEEILKSTEERLWPQSEISDSGTEQLSQHQSCCSPAKTLRPEGYFSIGCHDFMDITNFDLNRARKCCLHEITPDGNVVPFCLYNMLRSIDQTM